MSGQRRILAALIAVSYLAAASAPALAQTNTPTTKKIMKVKHAKKPKPPASVEYLRAAGSEPPPKAAK